ncbi:DNA-binding transcriptional MerR regulator [Arthrobacter sp. OAP107]
MSPKGEAGELKQPSTAGVAVPASGAQGLLFTEDLPVLDEDAGYRGPTACKAAGITYRQLDYWARTGLVEPAVRGAAGSGSQRLYGFRDILVLKVVKRLLDTGVSLQQIRSAVEHLRERGVEDLAQITLMSDGASGLRMHVRGRGHRSRAGRPGRFRHRRRPRVARSRGEPRLAAQRARRRTDIPGR